MLNLAFGALYHELRGLRALQSVAASFSNHLNIPAGYDELTLLNEVRTAVDRIKLDCTEIGLIEALKSIDRLIGRVDRKTISPEGLGYQLGSLIELIESEGGDRLILSVERVRGDIYASEFEKWNPILEKFPSIEDEHADAIYCYMADLNTACVFHCMRIAEIGLRALARERRVKMPRKQVLEWADWQSVLVEIRKKVDAIGNLRRGPSRDAALEFYRGALGEFEAFKDAYRNNVMHTRKRYDGQSGLWRNDARREFHEKAIRKNR